MTEAHACLGSGLGAQEAIDLSAASLPLAGGDVRAQGKDYGPASWVGANANNYMAGRQGNRVSKVIMHSTESSIESTRNWFWNASAQVSAHYCVASSGAVEQYVVERDTAYHAGNWSYNLTCIGVEQEGYAGRADTWNENLIQSSARLVADICKRNGIAVSRENIISHASVPDKVAVRTDPGAYFPWDRFLALVTQYAGGGAPAPAPAPPPAMPALRKYNLVYPAGGEQQRRADWLFERVGKDKVLRLPKKEESMPASQACLDGPYGVNECLVFKDAWITKAAHDTLAGYGQNFAESDVWDVRDDRKLRNAVAEIGRRENLPNLVGEFDRMFAGKDSAPVPSPVPGLPVRPYDVISGPPRYSEEQLHKWLNSKNANNDAHTLVKAIYLMRPGFPEKAPAADFASVQCMHETGFATWRGGAKKWNPAGIKTATATGDTYNDFERPATPEGGAHMLLNHWGALIGYEPVVPVHRRFYVARQVYQAKGIYGKVAQVGQLGSGVWAADPAYSSKLMRYLAELEEMFPVGGGGPAPSPGLPGGTVMGVAGGRLGLKFGDYSDYQPGNVHRGWDVWAPTGAPIYALADGVVVEVRDNGSVDGFNQAVQVHYPPLGVVQLHGHVLAGSMPGQGSAVRRGERIAKVGTLADALNSVPHSHTQIYPSVAAALAYDHSQALDPALWRERLGETGPLPRAPGF